MAAGELVPSHLLDPLFFECVYYCAANKEFVAEFDRLKGYNLSLRGTPIELEVDKATGFLEEGLREFLEVVRVAVYEPLLSSGDI